MNCDSPFYVFKSKASIEKVPVPCGKCPVCKRRRVNQWVFRLMEEEKRSSSAHFITLTYDTHHVPITEHGYMTLSKKAVQDYMKRLRKLCPGQKLKYYFAGEYGSKNHRPHYHAIVFNVLDTQAFVDAWVLDGKQFGTVVVGSCTTDSVAYCMKYIDKGSGVRFPRDDRQPEFSLMSKGLGSGYITAAATSYHRSNLYNMYVTKKGGYRVPLPRYYRNKIFSDAEKQKQVDYISVHMQREEDQRHRVFIETHPNEDYRTYLESEKYGRYNAFYNKFNKRKL